MRTALFFAFFINYFFEMAEIEKARRNFRRAFFTFALQRPRLSGVSGGAIKQSR
jgi:hypothetical protein